MNILRFIKMMLSRVIRGVCRKTNSIAVVCRTLGYPQYKIASLCLLLSVGTVESQVFGF